MAETFTLAKVKRPSLVGPTGKTSIVGPTIVNPTTGPAWDPTSDPTYRNLQDMYAAMSGEDRAGMEAAIARARAYYGSESDPLSLFGRLKEGYTIRDRTSQNALNARGIWRSGETGYQLDQSRLTYLRDKLDLNMKLEDYINGLLAAFAKNERDRQLSLAQTAWQIAQNQAASGTFTDPGPGIGGLMGTPALTQITSYPVSRPKKNPVRGKGPVPV